MTGPQGDGGTRSRLGLAGAAVALLAVLGLPWIQSAPNPLALGSKFLARSSSLAEVTGSWLYPALFLVPTAAALLVSARPSGPRAGWWLWAADRKSTRLNSSHVKISYAVFCLKKKKKK